MVNYEVPVNYRPNANLEAILASRRGRTQSFLDFTYGTKIAKSALVEIVNRQTRGEMIGVTPFGTDRYSPVLTSSGRFTLPTFEQYLSTRSSPTKDPINAVMRNVPSLVSPVTVSSYRPPAPMSMPPSIVAPSGTPTVIGGVEGVESNGLDENGEPVDVVLDPAHEDYSGDYVDAAQNYAATSETGSDSQNVVYDYQSDPGSYQDNSGVQYDTSDENY